MMRERRGFIEGVPKTEAITLEYLFDLQRGLTPGPSGQAFLAYSDNLITYDPDTGLTPEKRASKIKKRMGMMMVLSSANVQGNLRKIYSQKNQEHGHLRFSITAKINQAPDDLLIALQIALYWRGVFLRNQGDKYTEWHHIINTQCPINFPL
jgi:hypothetical protein